MRFLVIYAGTAKLTHTVAEKGCEVADPIDLRFGKDAQAMHAELLAAARCGKYDWVHWGLPCKTWCLQARGAGTVSYTHLTLPTKRIV